MSAAAVFARLYASIPLWPWRGTRPPEPAPVNLAQHRIYVLPTLPGLSFALAMLIMLIAAINYGLNLGYAFTFLLSGAAVASLIHAFRNLLRLSIRYGRVEHAFCGNSVAFHLFIDNPAPRRRPALKLSAGQTKGQPHSETRFDLPPSTSCEITLALPTQRRGVLPLGRTVIETRWPLGLIRAWGVFMPDMAALVFPTPEPNPPPLPPGRGKVSGDRGSSRAGNEDFAGLRNYQNTDSPRHLAWKAFARGSNLMTKQFSTPEGGDLFFDWFELPDALTEEARLSRLTAWLLRAEQAGQRYALRLPAFEVATSRGEAHLHRCLGALAVHGPERVKP
jgi:uncharacterized protein (DUF58 family)